MLQFEPETATDRAQIRQVVTAAFGRPNEADLIDKIRLSPHFMPELSIVAREAKTVVAHVLFSCITVESPEHSFGAIALAPVAVDPDYQNRGIGTRLIQAGLAQCEVLGNAIVIVAGHPRYYSRFGFQPASRFGIRAPFSIPDTAFMVRELIPGRLKSIHGIVRYPDCFNEV